jgi:serine/threonine protein phosphatase PrpC
MSRAIGDAVAHSVGVSPEPEFSSVELCPQDRWLLLATDGVWEFIDAQVNLWPLCNKPRYRGLSHRAASMRWVQPTVLVRQRHRQRRMA